MPVDREPLVNGFGDDVALDLAIDVQTATEADITFQSGVLANYGIYRGTLGLFPIPEHVHPS